MFKRKLIGKGAFTKAYQISETEVEVITTCPAKECYAMFSHGNPFAPVIARNYEKDNAYLMPLYPKVKAPKKQLNTRSYEIYQCLRTLKYECYFKHFGDYYGFVKAIEKVDCLTEQEKEDIISLAGDVCNAISPEDMRFEISPRNISHDSEGNLIMMDCFFCVKTLLNSR